MPVSITIDVLDEEIRLEPLGELRYGANISGNWSVHEGIFGGQLLATAAQAMVLNTSRTVTPVISASFIRRCEVGPAEVEVEVISRSRQMDRLAVRILQDGQEKVRAHGLFRDEPLPGMLTRHEQGPPELPSLERCVRIGPFPGYDLFTNTEVHLDPACAHWLGGDLEELSEMRGWFSFPSGRQYDIPAVVLAADAFPPPVYATHGMVAWVPTLEMLVSVRRIPETPLLRCRFVSRHVDDGLVEEDGELWTEDGELVAVTRQIAQFRMPT